MESLFGAQFAETVEGWMQRIEQEGLMATLVRMASLSALGEWLVLRGVDEDDVLVHNKWLLWPYRKPLPDGYVLVGTDEEGGPLTKAEALAIVDQLRGDDDSDDAA